MIFINFFYCFGEPCSIGNIADYMLCPCGIITLVEASSYSINQPAVCCKLPAYGFSDARGRPGYNCFFHLIAPPNYHFHINILSLSTYFETTFIINSSISFRMLSGYW